MPKRRQKVLHLHLPEIVSKHKDCCELRLKLNARVVAATNMAPIIDEVGHAAGLARLAPADGWLPMSDVLTLAIENLAAGGATAEALSLRMSAFGGYAVAGDCEVVLTGPRRAWDALLRELASGRKIRRPRPLGNRAWDARDSWYALLQQLALAPGYQRAIAAELRAAIDAYACRSFEVPMGPHRLTVGPQPVLMGILNVTPDSFSDGGRFLAPRDAIARAELLAADGAAIIDVGGESTRPGSESVGEDEELARVLPVIREIAPSLGVPVSIDTRRACVAREAIQAGACLVNDITGLGGDPDMARTVAAAGAGLVIMHIQGEPRSMQVRPRYDHLMADICRRLRSGIEMAVGAGVAEDRILVDPGIGFGKTLEHNIEILARLGQLRSLGRPIVVGVSRKRFIGDLTGIEPPADRTFGTAAACAMAVAAGALVLRVHDVRAAREAAAVASAIARAAGGAA